MKWSRYNHLLECKYGHFIYNAVTNSFLKISPGLFALVKQTENWDRQLERLEPEFRQVLLANRIVVPVICVNSNLCTSGQLLPIHCLV